MLVYAQPGDSTSGDILAHIAKAHGDDLYRFLYSTTCSREDASDLLQETYEAAYRHRNRWPDEDGWRPWLFTIARNKAISLLRRRALLRWVPFLSSDAPSASAHDLANETVNRVVLEDSLRILSPPEREAFALRLQGFSYEEIAAICGVSPGAIRSRVHRTRETLRGALGSINSREANKHGPSC